MNKPWQLATLISSALLLGACGSSSDDSSDNEQALPRTLVSAIEDQENGYQSVVGIDGSSEYAYFDLDTGTQLDIDTEEAKTNMDWDMAFLGTSIILNGEYSGPGNVSGYYTGNNSDFRDEQGNAISEQFMAASSETELDDFLAVTQDDIDESQFKGDEFVTVFDDDFYVYNHETHVVTANLDQYFLMSTADGFYKVRTTDLTTAGYAITSITFGYQFKSTEDQTFSVENQVALNMSNCTEDGFVDLDSGEVVSEEQSWQITLACNTDGESPGTGAGFEIQLHSDTQAYALNGEESDEDIDLIIEYPQYYLTSDYANTVFKHQFKWYEYNLDDKNQIWSQYGVYLVKTDTATLKVQITGYYNLVDEIITGRQISFIYDTLTQATSE